jgi:hypothetical protein
MSGKANRIERRSPHITRNARMHRDIGLIRNKQIQTEARKTMLQPRSGEE